MDTNAFEAVLGMDFLNLPQVNGILLKPARLVVGNETIPLKEIPESQMNSLNRIFQFQSESFKMNSTFRQQALQDLGISATRIKIDLFASAINTQEPLFCTVKNSAWKYDWSKILESAEEYLWANPPFSRIEKALTKAAIDKVKVVMTTPD